MARALFRPGDRPALHLALLALTFLTMTGAFFLTFTAGGAILETWRLGHPISEAVRWSPLLQQAVVESVTFSLATLLILGSHEMGHYLFARRHAVDASLPYFIPLPLGFGTLGAVIRIRGPIPDRNALVDIGAAGPLAGLVVALPILVLGISRSVWMDAPPGLGHGFPGETSLWTLLEELSRWLTGLLSQAPPSPEPAAPVQGVGWEFGDNLLLLGLQRGVLGPVPPGQTLQMHPLVMAGWLGLFVTLLNLIPVGQLDGGHLAFALFGRRAQWIGKGFALVMLLAALLWTASWLVWLVVTTKVIGFRHPEVIDPRPEVSRGRKLVCGLCLVALVTCAMPVPLRRVFW